MFGANEFGFEPESQWGRVQLWGCAVVHNWGQTGAASRPFPTCALAVHVGITVQTLSF